MEGGIHALKGFIYQATVILDVLLPHLESRVDARARPEGTDDLELSWTEGGVPKVEYVQIKKPRENDQGQLKLEPWTLREIAQELLPGALAHLDGNDHVQRWILGDEVELDAKSLL